MRTVEELVPLTSDHYARLHGLAYGYGLAAAQQADADAELLRTLLAMLAGAVPGAADPLDAMAALVRASRRAG